MALFKKTKSLEFKAETEQKAGVSYCPKTEMEREQTRLAPQLMIVFGFNKLVHFIF